MPRILVGTQLALPALRYVIADARRRLPGPRAGDKNEEAGAFSFLFAVLCLHMSPALPPPLPENANSQGARVTGPGQTEIDCGPRAHAVKAAKGDPSCSEAAVLIGKRRP